VGTGATSDEKLAFIEEHIATIPGDIIEIGCYKGSTTHRLVPMADRLACKVHACDSFIGMDKQTDKDSGNYPKGKFDVGGVEGFQKLMLDRYNVEPQRYHCHEGYIPECLEKCENFILDKIGKPPLFRFCYLDVDVYMPTMIGLSWVWPKLSTGGLLMIDDVFVGRETDASLAVSEWMESSGDVLDVVGFENNQLIVVKK